MLNHDLSIKKLSSVQYFKLFFVRMLKFYQIKNIKIPLPSTEIQKQLISEYTTIESGVENAEKTITKALEEIEGYYSELFQKSNSKFKSL